MYIYVCSIRNQYNTSNIQGKGRFCRGPIRVFTMGNSVKSGIARLYVYTHNLIKGKT